MIDVLGPLSEVNICVGQGHSKLALAGIREVLETANDILESEVYLLKTFSSIEAMLGHRSTMFQTPRSTTYLFIGGTQARWEMRDILVSPFRHLIQTSKRTGFIASGVFLAGLSGVLQNRDSAIHPNFYAIFLEEHPSTQCVNSSIVQCGRYYTVANGIGAIGLALDFVAQDFGIETKKEVERLLGGVSDLTDSNLTRLCKMELIGSQDPIVAKCIQRMRSNIECPVSFSELAEGTGLSTRQVERRFNALLGSPPMAVYTAIRLQYARQLLCKTQLPLIDIGMCSGFGNASNFARAYKKHYGLVPSEDRKRGIELHYRNKVQ